MQRICFMFKVKPEGIEEYKRWHANVWPEMLQALRDCGFRNYSLFMNDDGNVIGYLETDDIDAANARMSQKEINTRWQAEMAQFFEYTPSDKWVEVFHLD